MRPPTFVTDRHAFDTVIDVRSPAEFAIDHIPGAINCPVFDNEQRRIVGTLYKQVGAFEARRVGAAIVAENIAAHLRGALADKPAKWKPMIYCWRGGMRSGAMTTVLRMVGWDAQQLSGGYKGWRRHVIDQLAALSPQLQLRVIAGATGSAKTRVLQALAGGGQQVLDLEDLAHHKGSLLGNVPGLPQPSQTGFETCIAAVLETFDLARPVYVEAESRKIGRLQVPEPLLMQLRASPCIEINATPTARQAYLLRDYAYVGDDREALARQIGFLKELHSHEVMARWQGWALAGDFAALVPELLALHYDLQYARSQSKNFAQWTVRQSLATDDLSPAGVLALAQAAAALG
jgi:tRNA 2-selenouridine synthase